MNRQSLIRLIIGVIGGFLIGIGSTSLWQTLTYVTGISCIAFLLDHKEKKP